jgi:hypothetical protein
MDDATFNGPLTTLCSTCHSYPHVAGTICLFCGHVPDLLELRIPRPSCCGYVTYNEFAWVCEQCGKELERRDLVADVFPFSDTNEYGKPQCLQGPEYLPMTVSSVHSRPEYFNDTIQRYLGQTQKTARSFPPYILAHLKALHLDFKDPDLPTLVLKELGQFPRNSKLNKEVFAFIRKIGGPCNVLKPWQVYVLEQQFRAICILFDELKTCGTYGARKSFLNYWMCLDTMLRTKGWVSCYNVPLMKGAKQRDLFISMLEKIHAQKIWRRSLTSSRT